MPGRAVPGQSAGDPELLARQVTIYRDTFGIPHIVGETNEAMFFGFGYASAEDHLEKILMHYRLGGGRMAELVGESRLLSDYHARLFRLRQSAIERSLDIDGELRTVLDAYVLGINYYMDRHPSLVPAWAEPVWPADVIGFHRYVTLFEFVLGPYGVFGQPQPAPTGTLLAVSPSRTGGDGPILLVTCQAELDGPLTLYEAHLMSDQGVDVYGATFPGLPVMYVGCNRDIAWGFTPNAPDIADTYLLPLRSLTPLLYTYMGRPLACWVEPTQLFVRAAGGSLEPVPRQLAYAHNGPVVNIAEMTAEVLATAGWRNVNGLDQWLRVNQARSVTDFKDALRGTEVPSLNAVCTDRRGRIYYAYCAKAPRKTAQIDWRYPVDGSRMDTEWMGFIPFDGLPQLTDPPAGYVQSANGVPWRATEQSPLQPADFAPYLVEDAESPRSDRLLEVMRSQPILSLDSVKKLAWDVVVPFAYDAEQMLAAAHRTAWRGYEDARGSLLHAVQLLQRWDRRVAPDSEEALLFATWWLHYRAKFPRARDIDVIRMLRRPGQQESVAAMHALRQAIDVLTKLYGKVNVPWSTARRLRHGRIDLPVGGSSALHTLHQTDPTSPLGRPVESVGRGDVYKMVVQFAEATNVYTIVPFGNATASISPHTTDQMERYSNEKLKHIDLVGPVQGRGVESVWGTKARFELDDGNIEFELRMPVPVAAQARTLDPETVKPALPRTARPVGPVVQFAVAPYSAGCQWSLDMHASEDLSLLKSQGYAPVCVVESLPGRWTPLPAQWADDETVTVEGRGLGAIAVYLVPTD